MDDKTIENLKEALKFSPDNIPLRLHLANVLLNAQRLEEAEQEFQFILNQSDSSEAKFGLSKVFFQREEYAKSNVIIEDLLDTGFSNFDLLLLYTKSLVKENSISKAIEIYQQVLQVNPHFYDEELDNQLKVKSYSEEESFEEEQDKYIQKPAINFDAVGGMEDVKKEIDLKIIQPLKHPDLYKAYGKKIGGGILLYGPPGCGKTYLAKATAGQVNAKFISVSLNNILDMWVGNSEKNLHEIFELARQNTPCVLFFDEIDALGASRSDMKQSSGRHLINQFLQELDGLESDNEGVLILGATNTPWHLDSAFRRPGRFDRIIFVHPPDEHAREVVFKLKLKDKPTENIKFSALAKKTQHYSGADIEAVIDRAVEIKLEEALKDGVPKPISQKDLLNAIKKQKPSTKEWFSSAKNFALYANESGLYDDILNYMNLKK